MSQQQGRGRGRGRGDQAPQGRGGYNQPSTGTSSAAAPAPPLKIEFETPQILKDPPANYSAIVKVTGKKLSQHTEIKKATKKRAIKPSSGEPVKLIVNRYQVDLKKSFSHTLYRVDVTPDVQSPPKRKKIIYLGFEKLSGNEKVVDDCLLVFDSQSLVLQFAGQPLMEPEQQQTIQVALDKSEQYAVNIKLTSYQRDPSPYQSFGVAMAQGVSNEGKISIRGKYFDPAGSIRVDQHKCELLPGVDMSLFGTESGVQLQVDQVYKHVRTDTILDLFKLRVRPEELIHKIGMCTYETQKKKSRQTFDITAFITDRNPDTFKFSTREGEMSLTQYFLKKYNLRVTDRKQPLIKSESRRTNQSEPEIRYFLPEFSRLAGETETMKKDRMRRTDLIRVTAAPPRERLSYIHEYMRKLFTERLTTSLQKFGVKISRKMIKVDGVVLPEPEMKLKEKPIKGAQWDTAFRDKSVPLFRMAPIEKLAVLGADNETAGFVNNEMERCRVQFGLEIKDYKIYSDPIRNPDDMRKQCESVVADGFDFVYIILEKANETLYAAAKRVLCKSGIPSQVFTKYNVQKAALTKATKITLQIVCKSGGAPWGTKLPFGAVPTCVFGMAMHGTKDVFHRDTKGDKTMGAVVASLNSVMSDYYSCPVLIKGKTQVFEPIKGTLDTTIKPALEAFKAKNNLYPQHLIIYRDGGAEGDYNDILNLECEQFRKVAEGIKAVLTFVLVFKKTGIRIFTEGLENPKPGTLVENKITSSAVQEFYLQSNIVDQGSASATKYVVLFDNSKLENLPLITYGTTHCYYNWNSTIPSPSPLKYAEKLAAFAGSVLGTDEVNPKLKTRLYYI